MALPLSSACRLCSTQKASFVLFTSINDLPDYFSIRLCEEELEPNGPGA
jgi:rubredoxin